MYGPKWPFLVMLSLMMLMIGIGGSWVELPVQGRLCNDPYQIIQAFKTFDQQLVCGPKLTFSRMNNFGLTKTPFRRPRRYEFIDGLNVKIRLTDRKLWP